MCFTPPLGPRFFSPSCSSAMAELSAQPGPVASSILGARDLGRKTKPICPRARPKVPASTPLHTGLPPLIIPEQGYTRPFPHLLSQEYSRATFQAVDETSVDLRDAGFSRP